ncbi:MAG: glycosyltransferase family 2 protein [Calditrichaeota bacterium]|nr:glycosyltransferase family 2 protein [Calditrichota bacterium]
MNRIVLIPANNEEGSIAKVLNDIPSDLISTVLVVNNGSTDQTKSIAMENGAIVVDEPKLGYGKACLTGLTYIYDELNPDLIIFLDGDYSDYPEDLRLLVEQIDNGYDLVLGSRTVSDDGKKGLSPTNLFGNRLAGFFLKLLFGRSFSDLGPFRAIRADKLTELQMQDENFGWTIEMQIKAIRHSLKISEVPVRYRKRYAGVSKVTGSFSGSVKAFFKISYMFIIYFLRIK